MLHGKGKLSNLANPHSYPAAIDRLTDAESLSSIRGTQPLEQILPTVDAFILLPALVPLPRPRQRFDPLVKIRVAEIRHRIPRRVSLLSLASLQRRRRRLHDPVLRAPNQVVAPSR